MLVANIDYFCRIGVEMTDRMNISDKLLEWYYQVKRDLPWRKDPDPYRVWVSEIMLQQTRVDTVIPYYVRFMERFPTLKDLANAQEDEVLKYWEGLGYYSRARNLLSAVREVESVYGGRVPDEEEELEKLKGIGSYTKGAILSIAYNKPVPAVDGNVMRVVSRIYAIEKDIAKTSTRKEIEEIVRGIIPEADPSGFNQALMELGALICTPNQPKCTACPVHPFCEANMQGKQTLYPIKNRKEKKKDVSLTAYVLIHKDQLLIRQRQAELLKGLWEFPNLEQTDTRNTAQELADQLYCHLGYQAEQFTYLGKVNHIFSHLRWKMDVFLAEVYGGEEVPDSSYRWVSWDELEQYPFPVPFQRIIQLCKKAIPLRK